MFDSLLLVTWIQAKIFFFLSGYPEQKIQPSAYETPKKEE
jgi:hypothetical protein